MREAVVFHGQESAEEELGETVQQSEIHFWIMVLGGEEPLAK